MSKPLLTLVRPSAGRSSSGRRSWSRAPSIFLPTSVRPRRKRTMRKLAERLSVFAFAAFVLGAIVGLAFAAGYVVGQLLLVGRSTHGRGRAVRRPPGLLRVRDVVRRPQSVDLLPDRLLGGDDLLGLQGRPPPDRGSLAGGDGDGAGGGATVPGPLDLHALPPAGIPRGRAGARAGDPCDGGAAEPPRPPVPRLPRRDRRLVPRVPGLHDEAAPGVRQLQGAARDAVADVPVLRDAGRDADDDRSSRRRSSDAAARTSVRLVE